MSDKPQGKSSPPMGPPLGGSAGGLRGCVRGTYAGVVSGGRGVTEGQPPVGLVVRGTLAAAFVPPVYCTQVGTSPLPVPGMSQQAHERERCWRRHASRWHGA